MKVEFKIGKESKVFKIKTKDDATKVCYIIQGEILKQEITPSLVKKMKYKLDNKSIDGIELLKGLKGMLRRDEFPSSVSETKSKKSAKCGKKGKSKKSSKKDKKETPSKKSKKKSKNNKKEEPKKKKDKITLSFGTTKKSDESKSERGLTRLHRVER